MIKKFFQIKSSMGYLASNPIYIMVPSLQSIIINAQESYSLWNKYDEYY